MIDGTVARRFADVVTLMTALALSAHIAITIWDWGSASHEALDVLFVPVVVLGMGLYTAIGRLIVRRQPGNVIGWLLLAIPLVAALALADGSYAQHALVTDPGSLPFAAFAAWVDRWAIVPALVMFMPIFLLYPDGHLPSPRWRWVMGVTILASAVTIVAFATTPGRLTGSFASLETAEIDNPIGIASAADLIDALTQIGGFVTLLGAVAAGVAIVLRFRRADRDTRQQIRWLAFVGMAFFAWLILGVAGGENDVVGNTAFTLMLLTLVVGIPMACGIAILTYRLYDLDVVIRKTVVFGLLALFITVVYAGVVGGIGALVGSRGNAVLSFVAAALLAVAFQPARDRARRFADRVVYGTRATPYEVLAAFSERMGETYAAEDVLTRMAMILGQGTGARAARVWLAVAGELRPAAAWPEDASPATALPMPDRSLPQIPDEHAVEVRHRGELLGALSLAMPASDPMDPAKDKLVRDLAAQAGLVLRNVRLIEELRGSRRRLVAAQDEERRKLERNIHDGAQQQLVALSVKLRLAQGLVGRDPAKAEAMLSDLQADTQGALKDLRDLARGIFPPLLADKGLGVALEAQAKRAPLPVTVEADGIGRYPQAVESAVYFCALEALNNVAKYADASRATVLLEHADGHLALLVTDDGRGFDPAVTGYGTGLRGMADRLDAIGGALEVTSVPGTGTTVTGRVPIADGQDR